MKVASFHEKRNDGAVHCFLCAQHCIISEGERGKCGVRENREGVLYSLVYGRLIAENVDPIEKKPLFHFLPGSLSYSIATAGCNFTCLFCQNADISQIPPGQQAVPGRETPPSEIVQRAVESGSASIAYTYTEPTIFMEYALDTAREARGAGLKNVFVTNGFMTPEALEAVSPWLDGANVDLKAFTGDFYRERCGARLNPVLKTIRGMKERGVWIEITTLLIPGLNDGDGELREIAGFIAGLDAAIPWHVTAFRPTYRLMDRPPTSASDLRRARQIGLDAGLRHVYTGNLPGEDGENTYCHQCGERIMERYAFSVRLSGLRGNACGKCGVPVAGVFAE